MKFTEITPAQFQAYARRSPYRSFMQTLEIAQYRQSHGWTPHYVAVVDNSSRSPKSTKKSQKSQKSPKILAASMLVSKPTFLGRSIFYAPGGPLIDLENTELTQFFFDHLKSYAKEKGAYVLHIDPYYELIQRSRDGDVVPDGFNHQLALENLESLGFKPIEDTSMPKYLFALDLDGRTPDELFASFKQNTRNLTHRAERQGVVVRELTKSELPLLKEITTSTAKRRDFHDQPLSYYEQMYDLFHPKGQIKFLLAELPSSDSVSDQNPTSDATSKATSAPTSATSNATPNSTSDSTSATPLSTAMFMLFGDEIVYLFSGSDEKYMKKYNAQYLIQWHMIKYAAEHGFKRYNFYGIRGLPDPKAPGYGIYRFKKGFGGQVIELIGSFELPLNQPIYRLHALLSKLRHR